MNSHPNRPVAVRFDGVRFSYGSIRVLEGASFHVHEGEFAALVGPNGSGKTTVLKLILGLMKPDAGTVTIFGREARGAREEIGYVPQAVVYDPAFPVTVESVVRMGRLRGSFGHYSRADREAAMSAMEDAGVADLAPRPYAALSGGQRRRVLVARALAAEYRILVMDEPASNMDAASEAQLYRSLGSIKGRATVLVVTHDTGFVSALTDSVFCLGYGYAERGRVMKHPAAPAGKGLPAELYGGAALRVLHDADLPPDGCFEEEGK
jgi:zinc transport system ATP-binding protein